MTGDDLHRLVSSRSLTGLKKLLADELVLVLDLNTTTVTSN